MIETDELHPNPVAHAAIRRLRRNPPPPAQKLSLVHGDYRTGNFLYSPDGQINRRSSTGRWPISAIRSRTWPGRWTRSGAGATRRGPAACLPHTEAVRAWEESSGLEVDPEAFAWWQVFAALKGIGIWISSSEDFHSGASKAPILAIAGWLMTDRQQRILTDYLSPHSAHRFVRVVK